MAKCAYCNSTIFMGGKQANGLRFCNGKCLQNALVLNASQNIPAATLEHQITKVWQGQCPKCAGSGPIDVHKVHQVWSALLLTSWKSRQQVSCRSCARKNQLGGIFFSAAFGWWGFPWGLILTPVQISRNIAGMSRNNDAAPSADLRKFIQVRIGAQLLAQQQAKTPQPEPGQIS